MLGTLGPRPSRLRMTASTTSLASVIMLPYLTTFDTILLRHEAYRRPPATAPAHAREMDRRRVSTRPPHAPKTCRTAGFVGSVSTRSRDVAQDGAV